MVMVAHNGVWLSDLYSCICTIHFNKTYVAVAVRFSSGKTVILLLIPFNTKNGNKKSNHKKIKIYLKFITDKNKRYRMQKKKIYFLTNSHHRTFKKQI